MSHVGGAFGQVPVHGLPVYVSNAGSLLLLPGLPQKAASLQPQIALFLHHFLWTPLLHLVSTVPEKHTPERRLHQAGMPIKEFFRYLNQKRVHGFLTTGFPVHLAHDQQHTYKGASQDGEKLP